MDALPENPQGDEQDDDRDHRRHHGEPGQDVAAGHERSGHGAHERHRQNADDDDLEPARVDAQRISGEFVERFTQVTELDVRV
jgi:hypothetical protein